MKKILAVFAIPFQLVAQNWTTLNSGTGNDLLGVHFPTEQVGYAVGKNASILKTTNAGSSWQNLNLSANYPGYWFWDVHFTGVDTGFVVGESDATTANTMNAGGEGIVLRTYNGGLNWTTVYTNNPAISGVVPIRDLFVLNKDTVYVCGGAEAVGAMGNSEIRRSTNGGATWTQVGAINYQDAMLGGMFFLNGNKGFLGIYESVFGMTNPATASWLSTNNGTTFAMSNIPNGSISNWWFASDFPKPQTGYMCRSDGAGPGAPYLRKTTNGGNTWTEAPFSGASGTLKGMVFYDVDTGYVCGWAGVIYKTINAGTTWTAENSGTTADLNAICITRSPIPCYTLYCVGDNGKILKKTTCNACNLSATCNASSLCAGNTINLISNFIPGASYQWTGPNGFNSNIQNPLIANSTTGMSGTYHVTATSTSPAPCTVSASVTLTVQAAPIANAGNDLSICSGTSALLSASGGSTYLWNTGSSNSSITVSPTTTTSYSVTVSNGSCSDKDTVKVVVNPSPVASVSADVTINPGQSVVLLAGGGGTYNWVPATNLSCSNCNNPVASPSINTKYCVVVSNANGCTDTACVMVNVDEKCGEVFVPSAFSPDGDGENELHCVYGNCILDMHLVVYDRWGEKIFESNELKKCWDGTYKGEKLNTAVFMYSLEGKLNNGQEIKKKGSISLIR